MNVPPIVRALRPRQWVKNALVAAAPAAAGALDDPTIALRTVGAIVAFVCASSAVYLRNDIVDFSVDRLHPSKRSRPIASGAVPIEQARRLAIGLTATAVTLGFVLDPLVAVIIATYLGVNLAYSLGLKHLPWVELLAVASGFVLRAAAGGAATQLPLSVWFTVVVSAASLFVVIGKRQAEIVRVGRQADAGRLVLRRYNGAALRIGSIACVVTAIVAYSLWLGSDKRAGEPLSTVSLLVFAAALVRYAQSVVEGGGEEPEEVFLRDRVLQAIGVTWLLVYTGAVYG